MKKIINFVLVLALGIFLGYVFNNPIDAKLKDKFGEDKVEKVKIGVKYLGDKTIDAGTAIKAKVAD